MDVAAWLCGLGLGQYEQAFQENDIDAEVLMDLTAEDLIGLGVASIGHRRKLLAAIAALRAGSIAATTPVTAAPAAVSGKASLAPGAERRQLTVMFVDLVDSTALAARLDPEEMAEVLRTYQSAVAGAIARFKGHVAKYMGDGVLAYFGYPRAHEDEAERAVRAGLAAVAAVHSLGSAHGETLAARVGIATGPVVVGELIGEGAAREETVVGDTPNLAARLQTLAEPGTVVISARTQQLIGGLFELAELGVQILKGFPVPGRAWRVVGEGAAESRFEALHGAGLTPLVGREHEIGLLLEHWERAKEGEGQVVLLAGEPGIGKSRLVRALRGRLENEPHTVLSHYCSPHHQTSSLHPVIGLLERAAGFAADDPATTRLDKLEALLALSTDDVPAVVPLLAALLSLETDARYLPLDMSPHRQKERTLEELVNQVLGLATRRPVLALYEDVHWVDPTSLELLDLLVDRVQGARVLVLITFRPEFEPSWTPRYAHVTALTLSRLSRRQGAAMVARLSGGKALPPAVLDQIVAKTDGVPLFVEELTRAVLETNLLRDEGDHYALAGPLPPMAIPTTLHESLLARLDRLAPAREVAQIAAAIGREFSHELLAITAALPESELRAALDDLVGSGLVFRRGTPPDATYTFKHALVQDAAYSTLLRTRRQQLHARIAEVLEGRVAGNAETLPEIIAHHCTEAGLTERAVRYWWQAAQLAIQRSATLESIAHLQNGLRLLQTLPENPEHVGLELDMQVAMGTACMAAKGWSSPVTVAAIARAEELCERLDDPIQRSIADFGRYVIYLLRGQVDAALATSRAMLDRAERKRDTVAMMIAHRCVGIVLVHRGEFDVGRTHMAEALTLYDPKEHADLAYRFSYEPQVANFPYLAHALLPLGYTDQAQQAFDQLMEEIRAQRHNPSIAFGLFQACLFCIFERDAGVYKRDGHIGVDESIVDELIAVCTQHGFFLWRTAGLIMKGWLMVRAGQADRGLAQLREGITAWRGDAKAMVTHWLLLLANALGSLGELRASLDTIEEALALLSETNERWKEAALYLCKGELLLALSARDRAETSFQCALDVARNQRARLWELRAAVALARLWVEKNERRKAQDILAPVYGWFTEGFEAPDLQDAKALLDELARTAPSSPGIC